MSSNCSFGNATSSLLLKDTDFGNETSMTSNCSFDNATSSLLMKDSDFGCTATSSLLLKDTDFGNKTSMASNCSFGNVKVVNYMFNEQICQICFENVHSNGLVFACHDAHCMHLTCLFCQLCDKACSFELKNLQIRQICRKVIQINEQALALDCATGHSIHSNCVKCNLC